MLSDWRRSLLGVERSVIVGMRNDGELSEDVLREMQHDLDLEEALLERRSVAVDGHLDELPPAPRREPTTSRPATIQWATNRRAILPWATIPRGRIRSATFRRHRSR